MLNEPPLGMLPALELPRVGLERTVAYVAKIGGITISEVWGITNKGILTFSLKYRERINIFQKDTGTVILNSDLVVGIGGLLVTTFNDATVPSGNVIVLRITALDGPVTEFYHTIVAN